MKNNIKQICLALGLTSTLALSSCDSMLDFDPTNTQLAEDFYKQGDDIALQNITAIYNNFYSFDVTGFSFIGLTEIISDNADKGSSTSDTGRDKHLIDALDIDKNNLSVNELWVGYYAGVTKVNKFLSKVPKFDAKKRDRYEGEARFIRAYYYFSLVRWFGDIPLVTIAPDDDISDAAILNAKTRTSKDKVYAFIIEDLKRAIETCPSKSDLPSSETGRVTSTAAKTLLAKVYLYQQKWDEVIALTKELMNENMSLYSSYDALFREVGENCPESIFEIQSKGNQPTAGLPGYFEMQGVRGMLGWGFNTPSQNLIAAYEANDNRKKATVMTVGETMWDGFFLDPAKAEIGAPLVYNKKAYVSATRETYDGGRWVTNKNLRVLRYAEVLLMNAEAHARKGEAAGEGLLSLNKVRLRAGLTASTTLSVDKVLKERRMELAFEHDRWFDLVRTGKAKEAMTANGKTWNDKCLLFPIPQKQIDLSHGTLTQNPGY